MKTFSVKIANENSLTTVIAIQYHQGVFLIKDRRLFDILHDDSIVFVENFRHWSHFTDQEYEGGPNSDEKITMEELRKIHKQSRHGNR